jgi:hypothetical protein
MSGEYDLEAGTKATNSDKINGSVVTDEGAVHLETVVVSEKWYGKAQRFAGKFGVEQRGIERVPSDERLDESISHVGTMVCCPRLKLEKLN